MCRDFIIEAMLVGIITLFSTVLITMHIQLIKAPNLQSQDDSIISILQARLFADGADNHPAMQKYSTEHWTHLNNRPLTECRDPFFEMRESKNPSFCMKLTLNPQYVTKSCC